MSVAVCCLVAFGLRNGLHAFLQSSVALILSQQMILFSLPFSTRHYSEQVPPLKEKLMPDIRPISSARAAIRPMFSKRFILRFAISLLLTGVDADVVLTIVPSVFTSLLHAPFLRAALAILILGLIVSLARMWFLTFKDRP
jgi:hypothetical protein